MVSTWAASAERSLPPHLALPHGVPTAWSEPFSSGLGRAKRRQLKAGEGFDGFDGFEADGDDQGDEADDVLRVVGAVGVVGNAAAFVGAEEGVWFSGEVAGRLPLRQPACFTSPEDLQFAHLAHGRRFHWGREPVDGRNARASGKPARSQCREHLGSAQRAEALPDVGPPPIAAEQLSEMTKGQVNVHRGDDHRGKLVQHESGQRKHKTEGHSVRRLHLNSSTVANGSADHGRKRLSVNFVFCPGFTSTSR